jgi:hypothetical protein
MFVLYSYTSPLRMIMSWFNLYRTAATTSRQASHSLNTYNTDCVVETNEHFQATDLFRITYFEILYVISANLVRDRSVGIVPTGWTFRGWAPGGDDVFRTHPERPWGSSLSCTVGTGSLSSR